MFLDDLRAGDQRRDFLLLLHLPFDEGLDVRVIHVDDDHLGGAARRAARFDRARRAVADLEEGHQPRGGAAARELFLLAAQLGEVGARARAIFEQPRLAHPKVHDAAVVDEIVGDRLDEAGVRLRMLIGALRFDELAVGVVDVKMALAGAVDAISPMQAGVEPLRRIGRGHLPRQHVAQFVAEGLGVFLRVEIAALPAPIGPGAGEPVEHLPRADLAGRALVLRQIGERLRIGDGAPQEGGDRVFLDALKRAGTPALRKYFCASTSAATWLQLAGTSILSSENTTDPSGLRISLLVVRNSIDA